MSNIMLSKTCVIKFMLFCQIAECILKKSKISSLKPRMVRRFRHYICHRFVEVSRYTACDADQCKKKPKAPELDWVQCCNCHAWWHNFCADVDKKQINGDFVCRLCKARVDMWIAK